MTREEEIKKEAKNKYPYIKGLPQTLAHQEIFIEGAKCADKTMIEKVCEWLKENIDKDLVIYNNKSWIKRDVFIDKLKKAMEE